MNEDDLVVMARRQLCALGLVKQVGRRDGQPLWGQVEQDDIPPVGRRYLMLVARGRHEEAEQLVREAMDSYEGS